MSVLPLLLAVLQYAHPHPQRPDIRAGLDTIYAGDFAAAVRYFEALAAKDTADPAPLIFQASAYIWWASAKDSDDFATERIDSLLDDAITRARTDSAEFWLATALGYRAREKDLHHHGLSAGKDAKAMRDAYTRVLAADSACEDCYLGLGVYQYGLARAGGLARFFAKIIGLGSGNADTGIADLRRVARQGDLARVEAAWVLAAALVREADRDASRRPVLRAEARALVVELAAKYPRNPVFQRFLTEVPP
ncbi:MAG TPA: hypothetical protein VJN62_06225 [Gemmatimonadales bacterium]|nr:hypothetical protein [Gemmatimonadales bacterium]